jgi:hypothetical protein
MSPDQAVARSRARVAFGVSGGLLANVTSRDLSRAGDVVLRDAIFRDQAGGGARASKLVHRP